MMGKPTLSAAAFALAASVTASLPGVTGTPFSTASLRAASLDPSARIAEAGGPMKVMPAAVQASGNAGFSERNPYPG